jgi:hypothetical protein
MKSSGEPEDFLFFAANLASQGKAHEPKEASNETYNFNVRNEDNKKQRAESFMEDRDRRNGGRPER